MNSRKFVIFLLAVFAFVSAGVNLVRAEDAEYDVAVIDVQQVVEESAQIKKIKQEQQAKVDELIKYIEKVRKDVALQSDEKKKKKLEEKFQKQLISKKEKIDKEYIKKLAGIDKNISKTVENYAKDNNYDLILSKGTVLYGGEDITSAIIKAVSAEK